jgi:hypothetical protein
MKRRKVWKQCDGCGRREKLESGVRHWCKCHPAGFVMIPDVSRQLAARAVGMMRDLVRK